MQPVTAVRPELDVGRLNLESPIGYRSRQWGILGELHGRLAEAFNII